MIRTENSAGNPAEFSKEVLIRSVLFRTSGGCARICREMAASQPNPAQGKRFI